MADLQPNFELEDALTDHPPEIEPEVKRDFISSLEAEPYDDVVGETCGKTDFVPLLDDDDDDEAKAGSQEPRSKYHADGAPVECTADGQRAVLENGSHEIGENDTTGSFEVIVDEKPYSEFMPYQEHWPQEEQFGFKQPVFQLINQPNPFELNREDDVMPELMLPPDDRKTRPAFTKNFGASEALTAPMVPERCLIDNTYAPAEMDAAALISQDPGSEAQLISAATTEDAAFEADWLEAQRRHVEGAETLIEEASETVTVTPGDTPSEESLKEASFFPMEAMKDDHTAMVWQPTEQEQLALDRHHIPEPPRRAEEAEFTLPEASVAAETEFTEETRAAGVQHIEQIVSTETLLIECNEPILEHVASDAAAVPAGQETKERRSEVQPAQEFSEEGRMEVAETPSPVEPSAPPFELLTEMPPAVKQHMEPQEHEETIGTEVSLPALPAPATESIVPKEEGGEAEVVRYEESTRESAGKTEALQLHEDTTGVDITAPPNKELPPSPEKKTKPSAVTPSAKPAVAKSKPLSASSPKRPAFTTPTQTKKPASPAASGPATASTPKRPLTSTTRLSTTPRDLKTKSVDTKSPLKSPEKRPVVPKTPTTVSGTSVKASPVTSRTPTSASVDTNNSIIGSGQKTTTASTPKRPTAIKTDVKPADTKKSSSTIKSTAAELSRPKTSPVNSSRSNTNAVAAPGGTFSTGAITNRPKPLKQATAKPAANSTTDTKRLAVKVPPPKPSTVPKQVRPASAPASDLKNVRSKIGSTDNMKHQPSGGKAKVTQKPKSTDPACKSEPLPVTKTATVKTAVTKESAQKQTDGKVFIQNKKVDLSKVSSKCGSKTNIKHKPGGGDVKIESHKINVKSKVQSKVGSLDNMGHTPAGGNVKTEGSEEAGERAQTPEYGDLAAPQGLAGSEMRENGVGEETLPAEGGDQREIQSFSTHIQETN